MLSSRTYVAIPPGATIKEQLADRGMSQKEFAIRMNLSEKHVSQLINGKVELTPEVANHLEMVFGIPASFWNSLEANYRDKIIKVNEENTMEADKKILKHMPYQQMAELGWVSKTQVLVEKVFNLRKFYEVSELSILENSDLIHNEVLFFCASAIILFGLDHKVKDHFYNNIPVLTLSCFTNVFY